VTLETNVCLNNLLSIMREAKVYFHTMVGEHFGISIVEAMAAGLIPLVSDVGGPIEFVPKNTISTHLKVLQKLYPLLLIQHMLKEFR
jgi:glycosyltransferase involved in cell wall biosynthesis